MSTLQAIGIMVGVVSGVSGLVLGILNYVHQRDTSRPRLVVRLYDISCLRGSHIPQQEKNVAIVSICNVGQVPVTVRGTIEFLRKRRQEKNVPQFILTPFNGVKWWDEELKPQHAATGRFDFSPEELPEGRRLGRACVQSIVGDKFKASRRDTRVFAKMRKAAST